MKLREESRDGFTSSWGRKRIRLSYNNPLLDRALPGNHKENKRRCEEFPISQDSYISLWLVIPSFVTCLSGTTHSFLSGSTTLLWRLNLSSPSPPLPERSDPSRESGVSYLSNTNLSRLIALGKAFGTSHSFWHSFLVFLVLFLLFNCWIPIPILFGG